MGGQELTPSETAAFWKRLGVEGNQPIREHRSDGFLVAIGGRPLGHKREHRTARRALSPSRRAELLARSRAVMSARIAALEAGATSLDDLPALDDLD